MGKTNSRNSEAASKKGYRHQENVKRVKHLTKIVYCKVLLDLHLRIAIFRINKSREYLAIKKDGHHIVKASTTDTSNPTPRKC